MQRIAVQLLLNKSNKPLQDIHCSDFTMLCIVPKFLLFIDMSGFIKMLIQHGGCDYPLQKWFNDFVISVPGDLLSVSTISHFQCIH